MPLNDCIIAIMAKAPVGGYCKTRLIPHIGKQRAADLQRQLTTRTVQTALQSGLGPVTLFATPASTHWMFRQMRLRNGVGLQTQRGNNLGQRMLDAMRQGLKTSRKVIVLGTDCPALTVDDLHKAAETLNHSDHVLQPASDGGYVLVGSRRYAPALFRYIPWGSVKVMQVTRRRLRQSKASYAESGMLWDLDEIADYRKARRLKLI